MLGNSFQELSVSSGSNLKFLLPEANKVDKAVAEEISGEVCVAVYDLTNSIEALEYCRVMNRGLRGVDMVRYEDRCWTKDGRCLVCVSWIKDIEYGGPKNKRS